MKTYERITDLIGGTPLLKLTNYIEEHKLGAVIYGKLEYFNPAGSVKDRIAKAMIDDAEAKGEILYTFVESVDLSGKTVVPFCTSNSSSIGNSAVNLQKAAGEGVKWEKGGRVRKGDNAEAIAQWITEIFVPAASEQ